MFMQLVLEMLEMRGCTSPPSGLGIRAGPDRANIGHKLGTYLPALDQLCMGSRSRTQRGLACADMAWGVRGVQANDTFLDAHNSTFMGGRGGTNHLTPWLIVMMILSLMIFSCLVLMIRPAVRLYMRQRLRERLEPEQVLSPEEVLTRLAPFLTQLVGCATDSHLAEAETCSVCLAELETDDEVTMLMCKHTFHKACISEWLVRKGLAAPCPLCKCLVAPKLIDARFLPDAGVEMQQLEDALPIETDGTDDAVESQEALPDDTASRFERAQPLAPAVGAPTAADTGRDHAAAEQASAPARLIPCVEIPSGSRSAGPRLGTPTAWAENAPAPAVTEQPLPPTESRATGRRGGETQSGWSAGAGCGWWGAATA